MKVKKVKALSRVQLFATLWAVAYQASLSMGFFRQEYWSGLPFPSPGDLPNPEIEPWSPALQADTLPSEPPGLNPSPKVTNILQDQISTPLLSGLLLQASGLLPLSNLFLSQLLTPTTRTLPPCRQHCSTPLIRIL